MTDTSKDAIAALMAGVTPGPWEYRGAKIGGDMAICTAKREILAETFADIRRADEQANNESVCNARFIAAARELVPALAAERDAAVARAEAAEAALKWIAAMGTPVKMPWTHEIAANTYSDMVAIMQKTARACLAKIGGAA